MDRLKPYDCTYDLEHQITLHSNMDRLKRLANNQEAIKSNLYIPIWID